MFNSILDLKLCSLKKNESEKHIFENGVTMIIFIAVRDTWGTITMNLRIVSILVSHDEGYSLKIVK